MSYCSVPVKLAHTKYNHKPRCWQDLSGSMFWYSPTEKQFGSTYCEWQKYSYLLMQWYHFWGTAEKIIENMKKGAFNIKIIILTLSTIMKNWKRPKALWGWWENHPFTASNYRESTARHGSPQKIIFWWKPPLGLKRSNISPLLY